MSTITATPTISVSSKPWSERWHQFKLRVCYGLTAVLIVGLGLYGLDYYFLDLIQRPYSPKHLLLKPSGTVGLALGIFATVLFLGIFIYPIRKSFAWMRSRGNTRHWLDFHVLMGVVAPCLVAFHAAFKFRGLAGMAFWIMVVVAVSGFVGRYLYSQVPRRLNAAELSLQEARDEQAKLTEQLAQQKVFSADWLRPLSRLPSPERIRKQWIVTVLLEMLWSDFRRIYTISRLRRHVLGFWGNLGTLGGMLNSGNEELERIIVTAKRQAVLSQRMLFLSRTQQVFHLWHVVHKPFSYSFALLALIHIGVVMLFGIK
jgi:hypothetical protein